MERRMFIIALLAMAVAASAEAGDTRPAQTPTSTSTIQYSAIERPALEQAQLWNLSEEEWRRYEILAQGPFGQELSHLNPLWVLGILAATDAERRRYAELAVRQEHELVDRLLAFQRAWDAAWKRLYPGELTIDPNQIPGLAPPVSLKPGDDLLFFATLDCPPCDVLLPRLIAWTQEKDVRLNIYLTDAGAGDVDTIRAWARAREIPPKRVQARAITLNPDNGALQRLTKGNARPPYLVHRRGIEYTVLPLSAISAAP